MFTVIPNIFNSDSHNLESNNLKSIRSSLSSVQRAAWDEMAFTRGESGTISQVLAFENEYQVIAYIATRNIELSLRFDSIGGIIQYFTEHPQELHTALNHLTIRLATNNSLISFSPSLGLTYSALTADLNFCLRNLYSNQVPSNNNSSTEVNSPDIDPTSADNDLIGSASLMDYLHHGDGKL